jgi:hypothetical protein
MIQLVLHLHACADLAPVEPAGADYAVDSAVEALHSVADYVADSVATSAAPTETS